MHESTTFPEPNPDNEPTTRKSVQPETTGLVHPDYRSGIALATSSATRTQLELERDALARQVSHLQEELAALEAEVESLERTVEHHRHSRQQLIDNYERILAAHRRRLADSAASRDEQDSQPDRLRATASRLSGLLR